MKNEFTYIIITDSTADLTQNLADKRNIHVIPMEFTLDDSSYLNYPDNHELSPKEFYNKLREGKTSTTSQINSTRFIEEFESFLKDGKDVYYLAFSSGLSGTYQAACLAKTELAQKYPERKIFISDTLCASMGEGLLAYLAAKKREENNLTIEELYEWVESVKPNLCHWFTVDDLNHLKRGGRVSSTAAFVGTMLGIKPVLHVDDEGHLVPYSKIRGRKASLTALVAQMEKTAIVPAEQTIFISHGDALEDAEFVADLVKEKLNVKKVYINDIGPVIGSHSGPGTIALFFIGSKR